MKVYIELRGCDDTTFFPLIVNEEQLGLIELLSKKSQEISRYPCMPTLHIVEDTAPDWDYVERTYNYQYEAKKEQERDF